MAYWPTLLPYPLMSGYSLEPVSTVARTDMDAGPARQRSRYTAAPTMASVSVLLTRQQFAIFEAWYLHEINNGAAWFVGPIRNGRGISTQDCRFAEAWKSSPVSGNLEQVTMRWEIRERPIMTADELESALAGAPIPPAAIEPAPVPGVPAYATTTTVTVGTGGDYASINAALSALSRKHIALAAPPIVATVRLLSGFVMREQVLVHGINLGWIVIEAEDAVVPIDTSVLIDNIQPIYGINAKPAFGVIQGGTGPRIGCKFDLQRQLTGDTDPDKYGLFVSGPGSACHVMNFTRGFINAPGAGIYANRHGMINAYGADVSGAGTYGVYANRATINCHNIVANNCGSYGIAALYNARISASGGFANNAGLYGCYANYGGQIMFQSGQANDAGTYGIYADGASTIDAPEAQANNAGSRGIFASGASTINARAASATGAGSRGVMAINSSRISFENGDATGATDYGVIASSGSTINANGANCRKGVSDDPADIAVTGGSTINAVSAIGGLNVTKNTVTLAGIIHRL